MKRISPEEIDKLPSSIDSFCGILSSRDSDADWKEQREAYLRKKHCTNTTSESPKKNSHD
jgi:hypothetical protein